MVHEFCLICTKIHRRTSAISKNFPGLYLGLPFQRGGVREGRYRKLGIGGKRGVEGCGMGRGKEGTIRGEGRG
jgi:hypothetical protein